MESSTMKTIIETGAARDVDISRLIADSGFNVTELILSGVSGSDNAIREYAEKNGIRLTVIEADVKKYGRAAGYVRNVQMVNTADALIVVLGVNSRGLKHLVKTAMEKKLKVYLAANE